MLKVTRLLYKIYCLVIDELLPLIHQIWPPFSRCFADEEKLVTIKVLHGINKLQNKIENINFTVGLHNYVLCNQLYFHHFNLSVEKCLRFECKTNNTTITL